MGIFLLDIMLVVVNTFKGEILFLITFQWYGREINPFLNRNEY